MLHTCTLSAVLDVLRVLAHEGLIIKIVKDKKCVGIANNNFIVYFEVRNNLKVSNTSLILMSQN